MDWTSLTVLGKLGNGLATTFVITALLDPLVKLRETQTYRIALADYEFDLLSLGMAGALCLSLVILAAIAEWDRKNQSVSAQKASCTETPQTPTESSSSKQCKVGKQVQKWAERGKWIQHALEYSSLPAFIFFLAIADYSFPAWGSSLIQIALILTYGMFTSWGRMPRSTSSHEVGNNKKQISQSVGAGNPAPQSKLHHADWKTKAGYVGSFGSALADIFVVAQIFVPLVKVANTGKALKTVQILDYEYDVITLGVVGFLGLIMAFYCAKADWYVNKYNQICEGMPSNAQEKLEPEQECALRFKWMKGALDNAALPALIFSASDLLPDWQSRLVQLALVIVYGLTTSWADVQAARSNIMAYKQRKNQLKAELEPRM